jgi:bifunctional N-acetylglucosamine-1-phosphate-uridyltransferase/glucosamine-1-phosphate-acetyltransferase GlmU-like protein
MECHRGTIVANYDGANKHATVSEDEAHTGSKSVCRYPLNVSILPFPSNQIVAGNVERT